MDKTLETILGPMDPKLLQKRLTYQPDGSLTIVYLFNGQVVREDAECKVQSVAAKGDTGKLG